MGPWALYSPVQIRKPVSKKIVKSLSLASKIILFFQIFYQNAIHYKVKSLCRSREAGSKSNCLAALKVACYETTQVQTADDNTD